MISNSKVKKIIEYFLINGEQKTLSNFKVNSSTLERYKRIYKENVSDNLDYRLVLQKIGERYTEQELRAISEGGRLIPGQTKVPVIDFEGEHIKFGFLTDTHFGSIFFKQEIYEKTIQEFKKEKVEFICHSGDVSAGMSNRPGNIYELSHLGFNEQRKYAIQMLSLWEGKWYLIDGNHDRWFIKSNGAHIVPNVCEVLPNAEFLGHDEGDISLKGKATMKLFHGEDGNTYATSYRIQKIIEAFTGGEKPNILLVGHTHKSIQMPSERNIHAFSGGCIELQSAWMRSKRISAHVGFWIIDVWVNPKGGVSKIGGVWYPFYQ